MSIDVALHEENFSNPEAEEEVTAPAPAPFPSPFSGPEPFYVWDDFLARRAAAHVGHMYKAAAAAEPAPGAPVCGRGGARRDYRPNVSLQSCSHYVQRYYYMIVHADCEVQSL